MMIFYFNPRTREGCDLQVRLYEMGETNNFNPRTREGCDGGVGSDDTATGLISIHAPVKGATHRLSC